MSDTPKTFGSLFAGIGGIDLGLERSGLQCQWQVEIDPYCQKILKKHWPDVPLHDDVKTFPPDDRDAWQVDLIAAGFPCQDISVAGKGEGIHGQRSGLFFEIIRIARILQPRWLLLENVPALLARGMGKVLSELADSGYDAQWRVLSAAEVGAPHLRKRLFIFCTLADADNQNVMQHRRPSGHYKQGRRGMATRTETVQQKNRETASERPAGCREAVADTNSTGCSEQRRPLTDETQYAATQCSGWWSVEPGLGRVANGVPHRVDRLRGIGNAVVPQCIEELCRQWGWVVTANSIPGDESKEPTSDS